MNSLIGWFLFSRSLLPVGSDHASSVVSLRFESPAEEEIVTKTIAVSLHLSLGEGGASEELRSSPESYEVCFGVSEDALGWECTCHGLQEKSLTSITAPHLGRMRLEARVRHRESLSVVASASVRVEVVNDVSSLDEFVFSREDSITMLVSRALAFIRGREDDEEASIMRKAIALAERAAALLKTRQREHRKSSPEVALIVSGQARSFRAAAVFGSIRSNLARALSSSTDVFVALSLDDKEGRETVRDFNYEGIMDAIEALHPAAAALHFREPPGDALHACPDCAGIEDSLNDANWGRIVPQYAQVWRGFKLATDFERDGGFKYAWIVRHRPDKLVYERLPAAMTFPTDRIYLDAIVKKSTSEELVHIHDHFWLAPRHLADSIFHAGLAGADDASCLSREWAYGLNAHVYLLVHGVVKASLPAQIYDFPIARLSAPNERVSWSVGWLSTVFSDSWWAAAAHTARRAIALKRLANDTSISLEQAFSAVKKNLELLQGDASFQVDLPTISPQLEVAGWAPMLRIEGTTPSYLLRSGILAGLQEAEKAQQSTDSHGAWWIDTRGSASVTIALHNSTIALWNRSVFAVDAICDAGKNASTEPAVCRRIGGASSCVIREIFRGSDYSAASLIPRRTYCPCIRELGCENKDIHAEHDVVQRSRNGVWGVITTINSPTRAVRILAALLPNRVVVVGDNATDDNSWREAIHGGLKVVYLSLEDQLQSTKWRISSLVPTHSYARKMVGYLYAIDLGASAIYETDDDNEYYARADVSPGVARLVDGVSLPSLRPPLVKPSLPASEQGLRLVNPYAHFGKPNTWPRGLPLQDVKRLRRAAVAYGPSRSRRCLIQQGLANGDPDVDAVYRLVIPSENLSFDRSATPVAIERGSYTPWNSQNTLFEKDAFWALLLPVTTAFRVADIWRSYWTQRLLRHVDGDLCFIGPTVLQQRNEHDNFEDFLDELQIYKQAADFVRALDQWAPLSDAADSLKNGTISISTLILQLLEYLSQSGFFGESGSVELEVARAWILDLESAGYNFPQARAR